MRVVHHGLDHVVAGQDDRPTAKLLSQNESLAQSGSALGTGDRSVRPFDMSDGPGRVHHHVRQPTTGANQRGRDGIAPDQDQNALSRRPWSLDTSFTQGRQ